MSEQLRIILIIIVSVKNYLRSRVDQMVKEDRKKSK